MRVLLDECLPRPLSGLIVGHEVITVPEAGWAGRSNGELLSLAAAEFDVFVTVDKNLPAQQRLENLAMAVVIVAAKTNRLEDLKPLVPSLLQVLATISPGEVVRCGV